MSDNQEGSVQGVTPETNTNSDDATAQKIAQAMFNQGEYDGNINEGNVQGADAEHGQSEDRNTNEDGLREENSRSDEEQNARQEPGQVRESQGDESSREDKLREDGEPQEQLLESEEDSQQEATEETDEDSEGTEPFYTLDELAEATGQDNFYENIKTTVKVDGVEQEVNLSELRSGYQRDADYRQKTMSLAEDKKAFEEQKQNASQDLTQKLEQADFLLNSLSEQLESEYSTVNWADLKVNDPTEYAIKRQDYIEHQQKLDQSRRIAEQEKILIQQQQEQEFGNARQEYLQEQSKLLVSAIPSWQDESAASKEMSDISQYALNQGYTTEEVQGVINHRDVLTLRKAWLYDQMVKSKDETKLKKVKKLPKVVKTSGQQPGKKQRQVRKYNDASSRLRKSGDVKDAAEVLKHFKL